MVGIPILKTETLRYTPAYGNATPLESKVLEHSEKKFSNGTGVEHQHDEEKIKEIIDIVNKKFSTFPTPTQLNFSIHEETKRIMVKLIDQESKEVIKEIPEKKLLDSFAMMLDFAGLLVDEKI